MAKGPRGPREKKNLSYREDRYPYAEYPHGFRRRWPRKKAQASRAYRHSVRQALDLARDPALAAEGDADARVQAAHRRVVRKWGTESLGERVAERRRRRIEHMAYNLFSEPHTLEVHRRFHAFLMALTTGTSPFTREAAAFFRLLLDPQGSAYHDQRLQYLIVARRHWLWEFLRDEPEWEERLRAWVARQTE